MCADQEMCTEVTPRYVDIECSLVFVDLLVSMSEGQGLV